MSNSSTVEYGWTVSGAYKPVQRLSPYIKVTCRQLIELIPFLLRYIRYWLRFYRNHTLPFIDSFRPLVYKPIYGVPCGGIGCGSIGRGYRGEFCKFSLRPGLVEHDSVIHADQFIVNIQSHNMTVYQESLCCAPHQGKSLSSWSFSFPPSNLTYRGLYPRSFTTYRIPNMNIRLLCRQISPVFPNNYKDVSLPVCVFDWRIINEEPEEMSVSIVLTFRNGIGNKLDRDGRCRSSRFECPIESTNDHAVGVSLSHYIDGMRCTYSLASRTNDATSESFKLYFNPTSDGADLWNDLLEDGSLTECDEIHDPLKELGVAICVRVNLLPGESKSFPIVLAWDMPNIHFVGKQRTYQRRYTRWFDADGCAGPKLCSYALENYGAWEEKITQWQSGVLSDETLPPWYKSALFNELYFVTDGGSVWVEFDKSWLAEETHMSPYSADLFKEFGRFLYLESWEYRMFNTYDVHFYASFAMAMLWPQLEHSIQSDFTDQIFFENKSLITSHFEGDVAAVKTLYRVPHDLGNPGDDPWLKINAYEMHDTARWRDLNLKFILQCYRDYIMLGEENGLRLLKHVWPCIEKLIEIALDEWDADKDLMIENSATCDQTYDAWTMSGCRVADLLGEPDHSAQYLNYLKAAQAVFDRKLWTGEYYKFDEYSRHHDSIMADQLCGYWYMRTCGITDLLPREKVLASLQKIYDFNVLKFADGLKGAVNGMRPNGTIDKIAIQSPEVWTGVTYALASLMIEEGMVTEAFQTASGIYNTCFLECGLQYQTPEAFQKEKYYRAIAYMRPLAIWAMQWSFENSLEFQGKVQLGSIRVKTVAVQNQALYMSSVREDTSLLLKPQ